MHIFVLWKEEFVRHKYRESKLSFSLTYPDRIARNVCIPYLVYVLDFLHVFPWLTSEVRYFSSLFLLLPDYIGGLDMIHGYAKLHASISRWQWPYMFSYVIDILVS